VTEIDFSGEELASNKARQHSNQQFSGEDLASNKARQHRNPQELSSAHGVSFNYKRGRCGTSLRSGNAARQGEVN
jgi:hypothetical protein